MITRFENARIFTADRQNADCFVVKDGRFAFVGRKEEATKAFPEAASVDLHGRFVCPGFNDSHMHLLELGHVLGQAQLQEHTGSLQDVRSAGRAFADSHPEEDWVAHCPVGADNKRNLVATGYDSNGDVVANEIGVPLKKGYNGDLTSAQNGYVGGYMVKNRCPERRP